MPQTGVGEIGALQRSFNTMAVSLQHSRAELAASRARIVAAADQTRRRIERDLHDGIQQRLVSHGTGDRVLPVDACSRRLVPRLRALDDQVTYEEFDGGHEVPDEVVNLAVSWMLSGNGAVRT